ncbi:MAG: CapA family protein [Oscillospiraceae bacterium]|nr:CapA family protein [Oscillospiraceae bacterium]
MKMLFLGDVCPTKYNFDLFKKRDVQGIFSDVAEFAKNRDFTFVNLECALTEAETPIAKFGPNLKAPRETAEVLKAIGVDCCGMSNNHVLDFGLPGIKDTIDALGEFDIDVTGFGEDLADSRKNYVIEHNGKRIEIIAVCEHEYSYALENRAGSRPFEEFETIEDIREAKDRADRVIVIYHGGKEYCRYPSPRLLRACRAMVRNGADLVLCQHSHCIGCYENYRGGHILYGQGNFCFVGRSEFEGWHSCLAAEYDAESNSLGFTPIVSGEKGISLAKGEEKERLLAEFEARNEKLRSGEWLEGWREFCQSVAPMYKNAVANAFTPESSEQANALFGHYLDCEAHTDVWRELFKTWHHQNTLD